MKNISKKPVIPILITAVIFWSFLSFSSFQRVWRSKTEGYRKIMAEVPRCETTGTRNNRDYCYVMDPEWQHVQYVRVSNKANYRNGGIYVMYKLSDGTIEESPSVSYAWDEFLIPLVCILIALDVIGIEVYNKLKPTNNLKKRIKKQTIISAIVLSVASVSAIIIKVHLSS